ncbi:MFS transporter [Pseudonocardia phyllosphaerae]|uniref:MFS transporter n=1 Tax=Pseudonocardia phyllosphaerae TaxID=3390502 RepID=UPI00397A40DD
MLVVSCAAEFMVVLDASVVNVALPAIQAGLGFDPTGLQWVVTSYALVFAGFLLLGGRLADLYGRRRVFLAGLLVFTAASVAGGLAVSPAMLVISRGVQALGAAVLAPASLTILTTTFTEGPRRVRALAIWTALASAGGAAGSLLGGVLTEYLTWRATLLINLPIGAIALLLAARALTGDRSESRRTPGYGADGGEPTRRLDMPGAVAATVGLVALTFAVSGAHARGWSSSTTLAALAVAVVGLAVFVADEGWWSPTPLVPLRLFRLRAIIVGNVAMLLAGVTLMPMWYFLSLYMQLSLHLSALDTGLGFLPHTLVTVLVGAWLAPRLMARIPARTLLAAGSLLAAAGFWWQSRIAPTDTYLSGVLGPAVVMSVGCGLLNTPLTTLVTSGVAGDDAGAASGLMNSTKQVGGALGLAALLTVGAAATSTGHLEQGDPAELIAAFSTAFAVMALLMTAVAVLAAVLPAPRHQRCDSGTR